MRKISSLCQPQERRKSTMDSKQPGRTSTASSSLPSNRCSMPRFPPCRSSSRARRSRKKSDFLAWFCEEVAFRFTLSSGYIGQAAPAFLATSVLSATLRTTGTFEQQSSIIARNGYRNVVGASGIDRGAGFPLNAHGPVLNHWITPF